MWTGSSDFPRSNMMFSKCGLLMHSQNLVCRKTAAFTARGLLRPAVRDLRVGNRTRPREQHSAPDKSGWARLWGQGWARTGVPGLVEWDLQADILIPAIDT